ncbi:amidohydrolase family protein [Nannocystis sp. SCPEA4]|uniref:amidohydrolase family protein n=1 Tax=Nannocystis sp. SCPEA4 TaxID=2996787 RepID=UPI00226FC3E8|nr:amidohydrolase family protein [Nannocystis sp. SCPEA4]
MARRVRATAAEPQRRRPRRPPVPRAADLPQRSVAVSELYARSPCKEQLVYVIRKIGVDRVLFGSDFPFVRTPTEAIDDVESLGLTADEERMIFYENAAALLQLQQRE